MKTKALLLILLFTFSVLSSGQNKTEVTGKVTDTNKKGIKGVTIFADDVNTGVKTNKKGSYKVTVPSDAKLIKVLSESGKSAEQPINGQSEINFELPVDFSAVDKPAEPSSLSDEEVNIGYGTVKKKDLATPVSKVNESKQRVPYMDIYEMLRGKPGVQVSGKSVKIQGGVNSMTLSTEPLFVVDGVIVNSIDGILPQEVQSIEILKGSSTAIYGSRGANGVILITRKK